MLDLLQCGTQGSLGGRSQDLAEATAVPILYFHPRYKSDISALNISRYRNQSGINIQTFMTYFVVLEKLRFPNNKSPVCESQ